jgi:hypothetical protein
VVDGGDLFGDYGGVPRAREDGGDDAEAGGPVQEGLGEGDGFVLVCREVSSASSVSCFLSFSGVSWSLSKVGSGVRVGESVGRFVTYARRHTTR